MYVFNDIMIDAVCVFVWVCEHTVHVYRGYVRVCNRLCGPFWYSGDGILGILNYHVHITY